MLRAVLDSSVLVSIFLTPQGTSAQLLRAARRGAFVLCLSEEIIEETTRKLRGKNAAFRRRYGYSDQEIEAYAALLFATTELATNLPDLRGAVPTDPKDDVIVASAVAAKADYLVAGDRRHLLKLGTYQSVRIVGVREFLDLLGNK
jgi:putative PIN family toxin of toxin-antitoxin system